MSSLHPSRRAVAFLIASVVAVFLGCNTEPAAPAGPRTAAKLTFIVQPTNVDSAQPITPAAQVAIQDSFGSIITEATNAVAVALGNNPGAAMLVGSLTGTAVGGVASFSDLRLDRLGTGYTLTATSGTLTAATSAPFTVRSAAGSGGTAPFGHVFIVVEENTNYADVVGNASMPYLNGLARQYGLATQYYADTHPSIGNYFMMTVGDIITNDDSYSTIVTEDNIVRRLLAAGKTWKSYAEDLPSVGYTGGDVGTYARKHNVLALVADVVNNSTQAKNLVPFTQFALDLADHALPNYSFIVPNLCNDAHDCSLATADRWLQTNIDPLVQSAAFQQDGLLIILFDESGGDNTNGGGRVVWVAVSAKSKRGYQSTTRYQHESTLRLSAKALGLTAFPNLAAGAPDMDEFFVP